jgi:hypothetical protein
MSDTAKRELAALDGSLNGPAAKKVKTEARLGDDRVAAMPVGSNLIEVDGKSCTHELCWPPGVEGSNDPPTAKPGPPAREYPFKIDPFQQTAINALEGGEHNSLVEWQLTIKHSLKISKAVPSIGQAQLANATGVAQPWQ